jgi:excisionase family DNA binding protein
LNGSLIDKDVVQASDSVRAAMARYVASAPPAAPRPEYLTPDDVAVMLKVSTRTLARWERTHATMPVTRFGRTVRFEREALLAWLNRQMPRAARKAQRRAEEGAPR